MACNFVLTLSVFGVLSIATQKFPAPEQLPSFQGPAAQPTWSWPWSPINHPPVSWPTNTHEPSTSTYIIETWSSTEQPQPSSPSPFSATLPGTSSKPPPILSWSIWTPTTYAESSSPSSSSSYTVPLWGPWPTSSSTWTSPSSPSPPPPPPVPTWRPWPTSSSTWTSPSPPPPPPPPPPPAPSPSLPSLNDALIAAGAAKFAALISSDPVVSAAFAADAPTIFAPIDEYLDNTFNASRLRRRATLTPKQQQQLLLHASETQSEINGLRTPPGSVVTTKDTTTNLKGKSQVVVSDTRNKTKKSNGKRWAPAILPRQDTTTNVTTLVNIFSGLGNSLGIITGDIPYNGGLIHTTDGLFTLPLSLSSTAESIGETSFVSLTNASGQTVALDSTPLITVFIPTNDAFSAANISTASSDIGSVISGHVLQDFAGYLPALTNGSNYITQAGTTVTITIQGDDYFVNNAKILSSNVILENGVAHVIDSVLEPPIAPYTGIGSSTLPRSLLNSIGLPFLIVASLAWSF